MAADKTYVYCNVLPANYQSPYFYICDFDVEPGDIVVISIRNDSNEKVALVLDVNEYTEANAPYPPQWTKHVSRPFGDNEPADLVKEKIKVEAEKAVRFKSAEQLEKLSTKESLLKYGVGKQKINNSKKKIKALLESVTDKNEALSDLIADLSGGIQLSADGKTVTGFKTSRVKGKASVRIPSGVEVIEDNAFLRVKIDSLFLPKELKYLGKYTLRGQYGEPKDISSIDVEDGNENFFSDGIGFYSIENGKKKLEYLINSTITTYTAPDDVASFAEGAFSNASALRKIILSDGTEEFDEYALSNTTAVEEVYIPKTLKKLHPKGINSQYQTWNTVSYRIDEENEHLFRDEDSIYEVLEDGTYKLLTNLYTGKGKVLILEGTSVIGKSAFEGHENFTKIDFPKSIRVIEESAFEGTALKSLIVPDYVVSIGERAFSSCNELKNVTLSPNLETIASDAFEGCWELKKIKTEGNKKAFTYRDGVITKISSVNEGDFSNASNYQYAWMNGKIFVHTGLSEEDGKEFEDIVAENGGSVRSSTVLDTNYLVYNEYYDHETTKLRRARELQEQCKEIQIITYEAWLDMLEDETSSKDSAFNTSEDVEAITKSAIETAIQKDYFSEFAKEAVELIREESVSSKDNVNDRANYDEATRVISITTAFNQSTQNAELVKERVACAEEVKEGDAIVVKLNGEAWEVTSKNGKSLGKLSWSLARKAIPYLNFITVAEGTVVSITPKSKRRSNAKYAIGSVKFEIKERSIENLSEQDLITRTQFAYSITDKEAILVRWIAGETVKKAIVPASIEGKPVTTIPSGLFEPDAWTGIGNKLEEIVFSEGVRRIEAEVLFSIENIKRVVFPASVDYISPNVFSYANGECRDLYLNNKTVYIAPAGSYADKFLKNYKPDHYDVKVLTVLNDTSEATIDKLKMLSAFVFEPGGDGFVARFKDGWSLDGFKEKNIIVPSDVNGKALEILDLCSLPNFVQKITIPSTITSLLNIESTTLFYNSGSNLNKIEFADDNPMYCSDGYSVFSKDKKTLLRFMSFKAEEYTIPEGTEIVGRFAFCGMKNLTKLVLPRTIKKIDSHAFCDCEKLADIQGMDLVSEVGDRIFAGAGWFGGGSIPYERNVPVLIIGSTLLRYNDLSEKVIRIPDGITKIGDSAFGWNNENDNVEEIILPSSVTTIERAAFCGRKKLKKINVPDGVKEIPNNVFSYCEQIEVVNIPASVEKIEINAFPTYQAASSYAEERPCALKAIEVDLANRHYCSINGMLFTKDKSEVLFIPNAVQGAGFEIPNGVKKISDHIAVNNEALVELILPDSVTEIQEGAFSQCGNLEKVVFPKGLEAIGNYAFSDCKKLKTIVWSKKLKSIGDSAFKSCGLTEAVLPETIEHIGSEAFADTLIDKVALPKSVQTLGWGAFSGVPEIEVYDSIDPTAGDANSGIDTCNGNPNSMVGYIGMGPAWAMWECAANHHWVNYTVVVRSSKTDDIKYKVWMGADSSQRDYYCFLSSGWGHNATFAFKQLDEFFPKIRGKENKLQVAQYRLEYPYELTEAAKVKYEAYVKKNS